MQIKNRVRQLFGLEALPSASAAVRQSSQQMSPDPRVKRQPASKPSFFKSARPDPEKIRPEDRNLAATDLSRMNRMLGTDEILRNLSHTSPDISASVSAYLRTALTRQFTAVARNPDGTANREGTELAWQFINRMNYMPDYSVGYSDSPTLREICESLARDLMICGRMASELILDEALLPSRIRPLSVTNIEFKPVKERLVPVQTIGGDDFVLDTPCFFYTQLDRDLTEVYATSPIEASIKPTFFSEEFMADLQRVCKRQVHPRMHVTMVAEEIRKYAPPKAKQDPEEMDKFMTQAIAQLEAGLNSLNPEDAVITEDFIKVTLLNNGNSSLSREWGVLEAITDSKVATGAKVLPAILGHNTGSSNIASTETMLFMKNAEGMLQLKLNDHLSRMLSLALRLYGLDCYVEFRFQPIDLRPEAEMTSFKQAKQSMVLELLSLGFLTDDEAALELTGVLPPATMPPLSGTMFKSKDRETGGLDTSNNSGSTLNQDLDSKQNVGSRGSNKRSSPVKE